ncbi:glycoside hydrolase family 32 protein [Sphingobacterium sp. SGG-5]|uniref:glycoside hydrolase family 32 protein n=1 Tax=Sphingobacterium sp. SGG-5 TaxID=2710881 RepID=UPI0013EBA1EA|nr:glycoside hydrolase family 32 protein [Sphingobacterium sp. SGG-5]NGM61763.1 glycoside hydrolase family 32 protein [Sphingobacterium sp. SGG-5]
MKKKSHLLLYLLLPTLVAFGQKEDVEKFRPLYHFTPQQNWMNDPNGLVYHQGLYHLFYQYHPYSSKWGPMHWGHAMSKDLVDWEHRNTALYPDSLGTIFSGSAIVDKDNTAGFGPDALIAIYTSNHESRINGKRKRTQTQSIAYSLDNGVTWTKYAGNPVLPNPGKSAFRDPKVIWHDNSAKWVMSLTAGDSIAFYGSKNLKDWDKLSDFGRDYGAHGGVWECPDLFKMDYKGKEVWVLIVSLNPGGPNGGSATQYFIGDFDGKVFQAYDKETRWLDWGTDNYAGVTWSNVGNRHLLIGWMSNWQYANVVPTEKWRSTMTTVRELSLFEANGKLYLKNFPIAGYDTKFKRQNLNSPDTNEIDISGLDNAFKISMKNVDLTKGFKFIFDNKMNEILTFQYHKSHNYFAINRAETGLIAFNNNFPKKMIADNIIVKDKCDIDIYMDKTSIEVFVDGGKIAMTSLFFNENDFDHLTIEGSYSGTAILSVLRK